MFIAVVFREESISPTQVVGFALGLAGVMIMFGIWEGIGHNLWWAVLAVIGASTLVGFSYPFSRRHLLGLGIDPIALAGAQLILTTLTLLPAFLIDGRSGHDLPAKAILGVVCLGAFANGLAVLI